MQTIIVDSREQDVIKQIQARFPQAQVANLGESSGDLFAGLANGTLIIERKQCPGDLIASIADNRIFQQSQSIPQLCRFPFLVIDGELRYSSNDKVMMLRQNGWKETDWRKQSVEMALYKCSWLGMEIIRDTVITPSGDWDCHAIVRGCRTYADKVAAIIEWCEHQADRPHHNVKQNRILANPFDPDETRRQQIINFFSGFPGIGPEKAIKEMAEDWKTWRVIDLFIRFVNTSKQGKPTRKLLELKEGETLHANEKEKDG